MWDRMDAALPLGKYSIETIRVGFRPRPEFDIPPHPLFCKWEEFQELPLSARTTVALAVLAVLHDELSATPVLAPLPPYTEDDPAAQREAIVAFAVRDCLSVTRSRQGSSEPPKPDPNRLSVERAEAFLAVLELETKAMSSVDPDDLYGRVENCPAATVAEAVEWYLAPIVQILEAFRAAPASSDPIEVNGHKLPTRYMDAMCRRFLGLQMWVRDVDHPRRGAILQVAADYPRHGKLIASVLPYVTGKVSIPRAVLDKWEMDVRDLRELVGGRPIDTPEEIWIRSDAIVRITGMDPSTIAKCAKRKAWLIRKPGGLNFYKLSDLERQWPNVDFRSSPKKE